MVRWSNPGRGEIYRTCPDRPWGPPNLLYNGYRVFPGGKERPGREADPSPLLVPWSRKSRAIPLLSLWAEPSTCTEPQCLYRATVPVQSFSACTEPQCLYTAWVPVQECAYFLHNIHHNLEEIIKNMSTEKGGKELPLSIYRAIDWLTDYTVLNLKIACNHKYMLRTTLFCPEASVRNYHYSLHNNQEKRSYQLLRIGSLKWLINIWYFVMFLLFFLASIGHF